MQEAWDYYIKHYEEIRSWCWIAANGDPNIMDELASDEVLRMLPRLFERYDSTIGSFHNYAQQYFKRHLWKVVTRKRQKASVSLDNENILEIMEENTSKSASLEVREQIEIWYSLLDSTEATVVKRRVEHGDTYARITELTGLSARDASRAYQSAVLKIRKYEARENAT